MTAEGPRVAVVDDDAEIRAFARVVLTEMHAVAWTDDGRPGVAARLAAAAPDLVLLDLHLADGRSGDDVLAELRAEPRLAATAVVAFTASTSLEDEQRLAAMGFDGLLPKPFTPAALADSITRYAVRAEGDASLLDGSRGENGTFGTLRHAFLRGLPARIAALTAALADGRAEEARNEAHKLRGAALAYAEPALAHASAALEELLAEGHAPPPEPRASELLAALRDEAERLRALA